MLFSSPLQIAQSCCTQHFWGFLNFWHVCVKWKRVLSLVCLLAVPAQRALPTHAPDSAYLCSQVFDSSVLTQTTGTLFLSMALDTSVLTAINHFNFLLPFPTLTLLWKPTHYACQLLWDEDQQPYRRQVPQASYFSQVSCLFLSTGTCSLVPKGNFHMPSLQEREGMFLTLLSCTAHSFGLLFCPSRLFHLFSGVQPAQSPFQVPYDWLWQYSQPKRTKSLC